jgi:site-specific recombinase XerD
MEVLAHGTGQQRQRLLRHALARVAATATYLAVGRARLGQHARGGWLFSGLNHVEPLSARQQNRAVHESALAACIDKRVSMRTSMHSFATH